MSGETFASRVAASVLANAGLADCVAASPQAYEALLIALARAPERIAALRARLADAAESAPLFDTPRFTRAMETAFERMAAIAARGERPRGFDVKAPAAP